MKFSQAFPSKYVSGDDLEGKDISLTVKSYRQENVGTEGSPDIKIVMFFDQMNRGMVLNSTNGNTMKDMYGDDLDLWVGQSVVLWHDPSIQFAGKRVGGIRIRYIAPSEPGSNG